MQRIFSLVILIFISFGQSVAQRYFYLSGTVKDSSGEAIPRASIRLRNDNLGTATDHSGRFKLKLEEGYYEIVVSAVGYENFSVNLPVKENTQVKVVLREKSMSLREVEISNKWHDPSWDIIKQVIARRSSINQGLMNYRCDGYIKASDILVVDSVKFKKHQKEKNKKKKREPLNVDSAEAELKQVASRIPDMNFAEVDLVKYWGTPSKLKEERNGVRIIGDKYALYFLSVTDGEFDFYKNLVSLGKLSDVKYVSPFSPGANLSYRFKLLGSYFEGDQKIYRIRVTPRAVGNALFTGEMEVYDGIWRIRMVDFALEANHIPLFATFRIRQDYLVPDSVTVLVKEQVYTYTKRAELGKREGKTVVRYSNYDYNLSLGPRFFGDEISSATDSSYERTAEWWLKQRRDTLSHDEQRFTRYRDSVNAIRTSKAYLDSIDRIFNKITPLKVLWWGQGHINREKKVRMDFAPLISMVQPGAVGGFRLGYYLSYNKKFKNRQAVSCFPYFNYGFLNKDIKGSLSFSHLYDPVRRSRYSVYMAREFQMINPFDAYINMFRRSNFYDQWRIQFSHSMEIVNGLYFYNSMAFSDRQDIGNYKFSRLGDMIFEDNTPVTFNPHQSTELRFTLSYTPRQQYIREPREKIILGSKYPTFSVTYNRGVKGMLGSDVDFDYVQAGINQSVNYGRIGIGNYNIGTGKFFRMNYLPIIDYKYQRRGDPYLLTNPLGTYQLLPKTFPTFDWYLEAHYWHSFNGFLTSALPPLKKLNINAAAGSSMLWAFENDTRHLEVCYGLNKVVKFIRETFRFGIYFAQGVNNVGGYYQGIKISIENYNVRDNSWAF